MLPKECTLFPSCFGLGDHTPPPVKGNTLDSVGNVAESQFLSKPAGSEQVLLSHVS